MVNKTVLLVFVMVFAFGWFCSSAYSTVFSKISIAGAENANLEVADSDASVLDRYIFNNKERDSPSDWVGEDEIHVYSDRVVIDISNPQWATFTNTNSMDPVIDSGSNAIEIAPQSTKQLKVGDIISYESEYIDGTVIHRIVDIGEDSNGWYCKTKGDNNPFEDPGKIRFGQIKRVLVAIIY
ncbi:signal peptidase I [Candidatus Woesearchaeota archaeon]|nr:signal peptidase I [Candidatus Woesearchaeota archaeon]